jgi:hypothetical protein
VEGSHGLCHDAIITSKCTFGNYHAVSFERTSSQMSSSNSGGVGRFILWERFPITHSVGSSVEPG